MLGNLIRRWRHKRWLRDPFPEAWIEILARNVAHYPALDENEALRIRNFIQIFPEQGPWGLLVRTPSIGGAENAAWFFLSTRVPVLK